MTVNEETLRKVLSDIADERYAQNFKWQDDPAWSSACSGKRMIVLTEEVGEVARAILDEPKCRLREELVQVAAVAVKWIQAIDESE